MNIFTLDLGEMKDFHWQFLVSVLYLKIQVSSPMISHLMTSLQWKLEYISWPSHLSIMTQLFRIAFVWSFKFRLFSKWHCPVFFDVLWCFTINLSLTHFSIFYCFHVHFGILYTCEVNHCICNITSSPKSTFSISGKSVQDSWVSCNISDLFSRWCAGDCGCWVMTLWQHFGGTYSLHLQGWSEYSKNAPRWQTGHRTVAGVKEEEPCLCQ
jgi:hypothetical protein